MPESDKDQKSSIKNLLKSVYWTLKVCLQISTFSTIGMIFGRVVNESRGLAYAYISAISFDQIIKMISQKNVQLNDLYPYIAILFFYEIISAAIGRSFYGYCRRSLRNISRPIIERIYYLHLGTLGIQTLESPNINNKLTRADQWLSGLVDILEELISFFASVIVFIISSIIVIKIFPIFLPILIIFGIARFFPEQIFMKKDFRWQVNNTDKRRLGHASIYYLKNAKELQEVKLNNATKFFDDKVTTFFNWYNKGIVKIIKQSNITFLFFDIIGSIISIAGYTYIFWQALLEKITFGSIIFQTRAIDNVSSNLSRLLSSVTYLNEFSIKVSDLVYILEAKPAVKNGTVKMNNLTTPPSIEFNNVSFSYPQSDKLIFENLNLKIRSGEKVAIVGHNGAGKTTLVKLIARIYQVSGGSILINNQNLNDLEIDSWYKNVGILFQEYNFYDHLSPKENIYLGRPDEPLNEDRIVESAINADADSFINEFPNKYDQIMDEKFEGGIRPSTGQKQKIAIARFFYRNAPLAIFDEPTAAIDAVSEYNIFNRIYSFFDNKTVIIISHRFSTVRNADRIIVMDHGQIVEEGSHNQLLAMNGVYANAFRLQAEGYS